MNGTVYFPDVATNLWGRNTELSLITELNDKEIVRKMKLWEQDVVIIA